MNETALRGGRYSGETEFGNAGNMAPVTIALGPGFTAGKDCHR